jgi:GNAT superfamily N-acetyltransferase
MSNEPNLIVRRIAGVDLRAMVELLERQQKDLGRRAYVDHLRPAVQAVLEDSNHTLVVGAFHENMPGFAHGKLVGVMVLHVLPSLEHAGEVGWIQKLYVRDDYRKKNLGERLLQQGLDWAQARGLRAVDLEFDDLGEGGNLPAAANHLYAKKGFRKIQRTRYTNAPAPK